MPTTNILDLNNRLAKLENKPGGAGGDAEDIGYDNSTSHLTADNVQAAIDEVVSDITGLDAEDVAYDNTDSGLTATDVQAAIDEVAGDVSGLSADDVSYDNTDSGLTADTVQDAIDEVNEDLGDVTDNLNGFCFYPAGTAIVGLVSDDSPYTDANGNYILAASTTGQGMIDDVTYKSINSTIDARGKVGADTATPFKSGGGITLVDINPNKVTNDFYFMIGANNDHYLTTPVCGYKKIGFYSTLARNLNYYFVLADGTHTTNQNVSLTENVWSAYIDIPDGAVALCQISTGNRASGNMSLLKD